MKTASLTTNTCISADILYSIDDRKRFARIRERKREKKMEMQTVYYYSDCCGVESDKDIQMCSRCGEHCEIVIDDSLVEDYIAGYDDGEW